MVENKYNTSDFVEFIKNQEQNYNFNPKNKSNNSEILEKLYHVEQFKDGKIDVTNISRYKAEIEAQNYLLSVKKLYNMPEEEILETRTNLQYWKEKLENERFHIFLKAIGSNEDPDLVGSAYSRYLGEAGIMIDGAIDLLERLEKEYFLCLITNGIANIQRERIRRTDTARFFRKIFISQEIGYAKPDKRFFDYVLTSLGTDKESCIVIGDSLTSDIQGALNAGIESVYISFDGKQSDKATWTVYSYDELVRLLED